ncbi:MAG: DsrE/DsrF/DrsH-like family protein [Chitinophagales bacterium]|nr:DsrE/DsrF/DrsH-like family protein [Chitinophagales bacterium]
MNPTIDRTESIERVSIPELEKKGRITKVVIIVSKGTLESVYAGLVLANGALMEGIQADMFFTFFGLQAVTKAHADHLHTGTVGNPAFMPAIPTLVAGLPGFEAFASYMMRKEMDKLDMPHVTEFLQMIEAGGGEIYACKLAADMFHLKKEDFVDEVKDIITVGDMYALAEGEGTHFIFI